MAEKFAVYSNDKDVVDLAQVLSLGKALSVPEWIEGMVAGGTFSIPDTGSADAADRVVVYMVGCAAGTAARVIYLPANPRDGQVLVIKDLNAGRSSVSIYRGGGSASIDGANAYRLLYDNQAVVLRAQTYAGPVVLWSILAEYLPQVVRARWSGDITVSADGWYGLGSDTSNTLVPLLHVLGWKYRPSVSLTAARLNVYVETTGLGAATVSVGLYRLGVAKMTLGPYASTDTGLYETNISPFVLGTAGIDVRAEIAGASGGETCTVVAEVEMVVVTT